MGSKVAEVVKRSERVMRELARNVRQNDRIVRQSDRIVRQNGQKGGNFVRQQHENGQNLSDKPIISVRDMARDVKKYLSPGEYIVTKYNRPRLVVSIRALTGQIETTQGVQRPGGTVGDVTLDKDDWCQ